MSDKTYSNKILRINKRNNLSFLTALKSVFIQFKLAIAYSMATIKRELIGYRFLVLFLEFKCANRRPRETFTHPDCQFRNMADKLEVRKKYFFLKFKPRRKSAFSIRSSLTCLSNNICSLVNIGGVDSCSAPIYRMAANRKAEKTKQQSEIDRKKKLRELKTVGQLLHDIY